MTDFNTSTLKNYARQISWATGRDGRVWVDAYQRQLPDPPAGWRPTRSKNNRGEFIWVDQNSHVVNGETRKTETRAQEQTRRLAEAQAEVDKENPVLQARLANERVIREIAATERQIDYDEITRGRTAPSILTDCTTTTFEEYATVEERIKATADAAKDFEARLTKLGIKITPAGLSKFGRIIAQHIKDAPDFDSTSAENLSLVFDALVERNVFTDEEVIFPEPQAPAPAPAVDPLVEMETASPARAKQIALDGMVEFARPLINSFFDFIDTSIASGMYAGVSRDTGSLTKTQKDKIIDYCFAKGSFTAQSLDESRRVVLGLLTADETLARDIESTTVPLMNNHQARVDIKSRQRAINEGY